MAYDLGTLVVKRTLNIAARFCNEYSSVLWNASRVVSSLICYWTVIYSDNRASDLLRVSATGCGYVEHDIKVGEVSVRGSGQ